MNIKEGDVVFEDQEVISEDPNVTNKETIGLEAQARAQSAQDIFNDHKRHFGQGFNGNDLPLTNAQGGLSGDFNQNENYSERKPSGVSENLYENNSISTSKNNGTKIFTTTVMEKKKNINFKVIKNRERDTFNSTGQNGIRNNFDKNNKIINKNNEYHHEESSSENEGRVFQNKIINNNQRKKEEQYRNFMDSFIPYEYTRYPHFASNPNYGNSVEGQNRNNFGVNMKLQNVGSSFQVNRHSHFSQYPLPQSPKKKIKREINYLDILITAAEKIFDQGYCLFENLQMSACDAELIYESRQNENEEVSQLGSVNYVNNNFTNPPGLSSSLNQPWETKLHNETATAQNEKLNEKSPNNPICLKDEISEKNVNNSNLPLAHSSSNDSVSNLSVNTTRSKSLNGKCDNKNCDTSSRKKFKLIKIRSSRGKLLRLCIKCHEAWNNGQYCYYCLCIYFDKDSNTNVDDKEWIQCDTCTAWHHMQCEEKKGHQYANLHKLLNDTDFKYSCPICRDKKNNKTSKNLLQKKRNKSQTQNFYRKEYDFNFKSSNSRRIKEKIKMMEKMKEKEKNSHTAEKAPAVGGNFKDCYEFNQVQRKRSVGNKRNSVNSMNTSLNFLNDNENSREIIQDLHKLQNKVNNLIK